MRQYLAIRDYMDMRLQAMPYTSLNGILQREGFQETDNRGVCTTKPCLVSTLAAGSQLQAAASREESDTLTLKASLWEPENTHFCCSRQLFYYTLQKRNCGFPPLTYLSKRVWRRRDRSFTCWFTQMAALMWDASIIGSSFTHSAKHWPQRFLTVALAN